MMSPTMVDSFAEAAEVAVVASFAAVTFVDADDVRISTLCSTAATVDTVVPLGSVIADTGIPSGGLRGEEKENEEDEDVVLDSPSNPSRPST